MSNLSRFQSTRRGLLRALVVAPVWPALSALSRTAVAQSATPIGARKLHSFSLKVSDVARSLDFYQGLFGCPIQARHGDTVLLRIGAGPYFFSLTPTGPGEAPGITSIGISVPDFDLDRVQGQLVAHGISPATTSDAGGLALANRSWVRSRGPEQGGSGTRELFFADRDGLVYQLSDPAYCGGSGPLGNSCEAVEPSSREARLQLLELSHFTNRVHNSTVANSYHRALFGLEFQASQGPGAPVIGVGDGIQFLMYIGGAGEGEPTRPGVIDHVCLSVADFDVERILAVLTEYGLTARSDPANTPPLVHYISLRMPNRGGAEGGTPELYFSDPDGIRIQLQDPGYCGGTGYLGDDCSAPV
ncbi:MAG: hypothetical protein RLZZ385_1062 [Pseudomonadota bacterium]|jgi:catechol 2,3-dioxygenase-like lactoylglutathione lyase family enzyme